MLAFTLEQNEERPLWKYAAHIKTVRYQHQQNPFLAYKAVVDGLPKGKHIQFVIVVKRGTLHYGSIPIKKLHWINMPLCLPFPRKQLFQSEKFGYYFHFWYTFGDKKKKEATAAKESIEILTGWWKDVLKIFGTSWISCGSVVLVNENIWKICAPWRGWLTEKLLWSL